MVRGLILFMFSITLIGCGMVGSPPAEVKWVEVGETAPDAAADVNAFVVGTWGVKMGDIDPAFAKQLGLQELSAQAEDATVTQYYTFSDDGTFTYTEKGKKWNFGGKWASNGNTVNLTFETLDGEPMQKKMEEMNKGAEGGTQAGVGRDLYFDQVYEALQKRATLTAAPGQKKLRFGNFDPQATFSGDFMAGSLVRMKQDSGS